LLRRALACQEFFEAALSGKPDWDWAVKSVWYAKQFRRCLESSKLNVARCERLGRNAQRRFRCSHPAVLAIGYNNEIGNGFMSYSPADRERFVAWLRRKYGDLQSLNRGWATQRWSRRIGSWDEVTLPYAEGPGPFERQLDLRRYWSDETIDVLRELDAVRRKYTPDKPAISNLWDSSGLHGETAEAPTVERSERPTGAIERGAT
jgi:beta-galactosidase GanA